MFRRSPEKFEPTFETAKTEGEQLAELQKRLLEKENGVFSKFGEKAKEAGRWFMIATTVAFGAEAAVAENLQKEAEVQKSIRLITSIETIKALLDQGVSFTEDGGVRLYVDREIAKKRGYVGLAGESPVMTLRYGEMGGIRTDSLKINQLELGFEIVSFESDGSRNRVLLDQEGEFQKLSTIKGEEVVGEMTAEDVIDQQLK